jgi:hypothetical protein
MPVSRHPEDLTQTLEWLAIATSERYSLLTGQQPRRLES